LAHKPDQMSRLTRAPVDCWLSW